MHCDAGKCEIEFAFESNMPIGEGRTMQKYEATWYFDGAGFHESAKLSFKWLPLIGTFKAESFFTAQ